MPEYNLNVLNQLEAPMPWIGMYAAAASTVCTLAMAADALHGFRTTKYWFPSKYFSLNATSLTLLAVAMKLPVDLTTQIFTVTDRLAKVSSLAFMSTAMANFLTSLGSMDGSSVVMNVTALAILVITIIANVCIQIIQMRSYLSSRLAFWEEAFAMASMIVLLAVFVSSAVMIPSSKRYLESKYNELHKSALSEDKLRVLIKKYWVMAETSSPQFVMARAATSSISGMVSLLMALVLVEAEIRMAMKYRILEETSSNYKWSTKWILLCQSVGVIVGAIAPTSRWFFAMNHRSSSECRNIFRNAFVVEGYWTQKLEEWQESSLSLQIHHLKSRKVIHDLKGLILKLCISVQHLIVVASKLALAVSICAAKPFHSCLSHVQISDSTSSCNYVMLLEGEAELPAKTMRNICKEVDEIIEKGKTRKPEHLLNLLSESCNHHIPTLPSQLLLPYCWSLPVVTLACIALAIPNVEKEKSERLLRSVTEGLRFVKLIDKALDREGDLSNTRAAADAVWVKVELYHKWQDKDLHETSIKGKNAEEVLQQLQEKSERRVMELKKDGGGQLKAIAANAMSRASRRILRGRGKREKRDEEVFEEIRVMIADIVAECLTNLARAVSIKCQRSAIEERERGVREAAMLVGETEEILALLQQREFTILATRQAAYIEEWRTWIDDLQNKDDHVTIKVEDSY